MKRAVTGLTIAGILIVVFGTIYSVAQQVQRNDANYPQIQLAEDTAAQIKKDGDPYLSSLAAPVNMDESLAPFIIVYDKKGSVISGSGYLNGKVPKAPTGILSSANGKDYNAVTWEPRKDVRIAAVTVAAKNYYVLSGRSLTEVEKNESVTFKLAFIGGALSLLILGVGIVARDLAAAGTPRHPGDRPAV